MSNPVSASDIGLPIVSRRAVLGAASAALIPFPALAAPQESIASPEDPHTRWLSQWRALHDAWIVEFNKSDEDTEESEAIWAKRERIEVLLYTTPAKTSAGIKAQITWVIEDSGGASVCKGHLEALSLSVGSLA